MSDKDKVAYISIMNAIAIIAVIIGHLDITGPNEDPNTPIANAISAFGSFQMPLFMCVSGFLFAMTSGFQKGWKKLMLSKVKRLLVPFLFLTVFTFGFKMCLPASMLEHGVELTIEYLFRMFFVPFRGPVPHLWFVVSLFSIFAVTPMLKETLNNKRISVLTFIILLYLPGLFPFLRTEYLALDHTLSLIGWFYLGMVMRKNNISEKLNSWSVLVISGIIYIVSVYWLIIPYVGNQIKLLAGIAFVFCISQIIANYYDGLFGSWRNYTFQIYLLHMYPIMACKFLYKRHLWEDNFWFAICWILGLLLAVYLPTIVAKIIAKMPKPVRLLIGLY